MPRTRRKVRISSSERARRRKQALINFGLRAKPLSRARVIRRGATMARRTRRGGNLRRRFSRGGSKLGSEVGILGYALVGEPLVDRFASQLSFGIPSSLIKVGAGFVLRKRGGMVGQIGNAMYTISLYQLGKQMLSGGLNLGGLFGTTSTSTTSTSDATF